MDTIAVGQYEGPLGAAAMAVITPLYSVIIFLAILCGIGGSVLTANAWGEGRKEKGNAYFTASIVLMTVLTAVIDILHLPGIEAENVLYYCRFLEDEYKESIFYVTFV